MTMVREVICNQVRDAVYFSLIVDQGILCKNQCFKFMVCLVIFDYLFSLTKGLSDALQ